VLVCRQNIKDTICELQKKVSENEKQAQDFDESDERKKTAVHDGGDQGVHPPPVGVTNEQIFIKFVIPKGKVAGIMGVMNLLQSKFNTLEISLNAKDGNISQQDIEDKIEETFRQLNIHFEILKE
jgi:hypothetical protein